MIKNFKSSQGKKNILTYKVTPIRPENFSAETLQAGREWNDIFKILKD